METEKKKQIETSILRRIKFDDLDRAEALIRLPEYQKDLRKYLKIKNPTFKKRREFCKKYGLLCVLTPNLLERIKNPKVTGFAKGKFIPHKKMQEHLPEKVMERKRLLLNQLFIKKPFHVRVKVDLNKPIKENLFLVRKDIEALQQFIEEVGEEHKLRIRKHTYSP